MATPSDQIIWANRVFETTDNRPNASTAYNLAGAIDGFQTFVAGIGDLKTCVYCAQEIDGQNGANGDWEVGIGTVADATPDTLTRTHLIDSSTGSLIDWSTATGLDTDPNIFVCDPAAFFRNRGGLSPSGEQAKWFGPCLAANPTTTTFAADRVRVALISWPIGVPIGNAGIEITAIVGGPNDFRIGLYDDDAGLPGALLWESPATAETAAIHTFVISTPVYPRSPWVWGAFVSSVSNTTVRGRTAANSLYMSSVIGFPTAGATARNLGMYVTDANAVSVGLPNPWGTPTYPSDSKLPEVRIQR